jgi:hypothetical protein
MKKLISLAPILMVLTGCDQQAIEFARKADDLLTAYQKRINEQMAESTKFYQRSATFEALRARRLILENLEAERNERSTALEADLRGGRRFASLYRTYLRDYADGHYQKTVEWLSADTDAVAPYLQQLVALESDQAVIDAFGKSLKNLEKPRGLIAQANDVKDFVQGTKQEFDKLLCTDLKGKMDKATGDEKKTLTTMFDDKKCADILK